VLPSLLMMIWLEVGQYVSVPHLVPVISTDQFLNGKVPGIITHVDLATEGLDKSAARMITSLSRSKLLLQVIQHRLYVLKK